jgi:hypothetical protein
MNIKHSCDVVKLQNGISSRMHKHFYFLTYIHKQKFSVEIFFLTTADPIRLRIESRNRHIYDVMSVLFDVTMHILTLHSCINSESHVFLFFIFILTILFSFFFLIACYGHIAQ